MKELTKEVVTREVTGYEAFDGKFFNSKEECEKYEGSAKGVAAAGAMEYRIGKGTQYNLFNEAPWDCNVEVFDIKNSDVLFKVNMYIALQTDKDDFLISDEYIGKHVIIMWGYDRDWCSWSTLDELVEYMTKGYEKIVGTTETK